MSIDSTHGSCWTLGFQSRPFFQIPTCHLQKMKPRGACTLEMMWQSFRQRSGMRNRL